MRITKFGHACLLVTDADARVLIDPGVFSPGWETLTGLTGVLVTHSHPDHVDPARIGALISANPTAAVHADADGANVMAEAGVTASVVAPGDTLDVGTAVEVVGGDGRHALIHPDVPRVTNVGYLIGGRLLHPGDSLEVPAQDVEILALPVMAPWMALKEAIEFYRAVDPAIGVPIHEKLLANTSMFYAQLARLGPAGSRFLDLDDGAPVDL